MLNIERLQNRLQYKFHDLRLLELALTHCSMGVNNNQRLEFLGDAVLQLVITDSLFVKFFKSSEGALTRLRSKLVCGVTLAKIAIDLQLSGYLIRASSGRNSNYLNRNSILSDTFEAIIGAIYLDSNLDICRNWILKLYKNKLDEINELEIKKDPKTTLQEFLQAMDKDLPVYRVVSSSGYEHEKIFTVSVSIDLFNYIGVGSGASIRWAEQDAAKRLLELLNA